MQNTTDNIIFEVEADDISLKDFRLHKDLEPSLWDEEDKLIKGVRNRLLDIADDFVDTLATPWVKVKDVVFTGSLANYNWSSYSDIDLHVIIKFKDVWEKRTDFVSDYFKTKKKEWAAAHNNLKINGYPVEITVEDEDEPTTATGVYSLKSNKWLQEPGDINDARMNQEYIKTKASEYMTKIDDIIDDINKADDSKEKWKHAEKLMALFDKLKTMRHEGLASEASEMSSGNIIWKVLRRAGYIEDLWNTVNNAYDISMSMSRRKH